MPEKNNLNKLDLRSILYLACAGGLILLFYFFQPSTGKIFRFASVFFLGYSIIFILRNWRTIIPPKNESINKELGFTKVHLEEGAKLNRTKALLFIWITILMIAFNAYNVYLSSMSIDWFMIILGIFSTFLFVVYIISNKIFSISTINSETSTPIREKTETFPYLDDLNRVQGVSNKKKIDRERK